MVPRMVSHTESDGSVTLFRPMRQEYLDSGLLEIMLCEANPDGTIRRDGRTVEATADGPGFAVEPYCYLDVRSLGRALVNEACDQHLFTITSLLPRLDDSICPLTLVDQGWLDGMGDYGIVEDYLE